MKTHVVIERQPRQPDVALAHPGRVADGDQVGEDGSRRKLDGPGRGQTARRVLEEYGRVAGIAPVGRGISALVWLVEGDDGQVPSDAHLVGDAVESAAGDD